VLVSISFIGGGCAMRGRHTPLERLLGAPASPERHHQLAELYTAKAEQARAQAGRHLSMAARYRSEAEAATGEEAEIRRMLVDHCEALAHDFEDEAARYEAMAANHHSLSDVEYRVLPRDRSGDRQETGY